MLAAPLMAGNDVRDMSAATRAILTAAEVIALDQDPFGKQGVRIRHGESGDVWARQLRGGVQAVLFLNRSGAQTRMTVTWAELGQSGPRAVRDLWERADLGVSAEGHEAAVAPHAAAIFSLAPMDA